MILISSSVTGYNNLFNSQPYWLSLTEDTIVWLILIYIFRIMASDKKCKHGPDIFWYICGCFTGLLFTKITDLVYL